MKTVSATTASLVGTLEPVYGVTAAALVLGEFPSESGHWWSGRHVGRGENQYKK